MRNLPEDQVVLAEVNEMVRQFVNADIPPNEPSLPPGYRCDMSRVYFIRERWNRAVEVYKKEYGLDPVESLARIEAELRRNAAVLHVERR